MLRALRSSLVLLLACTACLQASSTGQEGVTDPVEVSWASYSLDGFSVDLPAGWGETEASDEQVLHNVSDGQASLWIKSWPLIPSLVEKGVEEWTAGNKNAALLDRSGDAKRVQLEMALHENFNTLRLSSLLIYCDARSYEVTGVVEEAGYNRYSALFDQVQASASCNQGEPVPQLESGALGMIVIPPAVDGEAFDPAAYQQALALARRSGVQVSHYYFHWGDIEKEPGVFDWTVPDYIIEANGLEGLQLSIVVSIIHTSVRGRIPNDLHGLPFDDPLFVERLSGFMAAFAQRYAGRVHYLAIGNEVNNYFATHRDELPAYASAFEQAREAIHVAAPDLPVGIVFAYHDAETLGTTDIIQRLNLGDYIAYTLYLYNQGFHFQRDPGEIGDYLDRMLDLAGDTPVAIVETGWSTAPELDGSEAGQAEYVRQLFKALRERRDRIRFVSWFVLHDPLQESCEKDALTFFEPGTEPDGEAMQAFVTFLCHFGLRESDGTPKQAWDAWVQEAQEYYR